VAVADLTVGYLRQVLNYDPETGVFTWRRHPQEKRIGLPVGRTDRQGYLKIVLDGVAFTGHRLAWMHVHGKFPKGCIDHINGDRLDNRLANLRDVAPMLNSQNRRGANRTNRSGLLGAHFHKASGRWHSRITLAGHTFQLGYFATPEEAHAAHMKAKRKLHRGNTL
jgi:hypothetical protein